MVTVDAVIVKPIFSRLKPEAENILGFEKVMVSFLIELETLWREMADIQTTFKPLTIGGSLSHVDELNLQNIENQANLLHFKILEKKIEFERNWKPSILSLGTNLHDDFLNQVTYIIEEDMIPLSAGLRESIRTRSEWINSRKTEKIDKTLQFTNLILILVIYSEIFIGIAQIYNQYQIFLILLALVVPIIVIIIGFKNSGFNLKPR
jgi:hypothetical protein